MAEESQILSASFSTEAALYLAYMPFIKGGGIFIRSIMQLDIGTSVRLNIILPKEMEPFLVDAKVIWVTPRGAQANKPAGLGCQFIGDNASVFNNKIETLLAGMLKSTQLTDTM